MTRAIRILGLLALATGCSGGPSEAELAKRNRELAAAADPAVTAAMEDPIMSDRDLGVADDSLRVRHVGGPAEALYPSRTGANAAAFAALKGVGFTPSPCETGFVYGNAWAARMPAPFRLPQGATLVEAAGNDRPGCRSRMAAFRVAATPPSVIAAIRAGAMQAGYTALVQVRGSDQVVAGRRSADGATYYAIATPQGPGSEVSLLTAAKSPLR